MNSDILAQLEEKIQHAVESIEMLKLENEELKAENTQLKGNSDSVEQRLGGLLDKLKSLDSQAPASSENTAQSAPAQQSTPSY